MQSYLKSGDIVIAVLVLKPDKSTRRIEGGELRSILEKLDKEGNYAFDVEGEITLVEAQGERVSLFIIFNSGCTLFLHIPSATFCNSRATCS